MNELSGCMRRLWLKRKPSIYENPISPSSSVYTETSEPYTPHPAVEASSSEKCEPHRPICSLLHYNPSSSQHSPHSQWASSVSWYISALTPQKTRVTRTNARCVPDARRAWPGPSAPAAASAAAAAAARVFSNQNTSSHKQDRRRELRRGCWLAEHDVTLGYRSTHRDHFPPAILTDARGFKETVLYLCWLTEGYFQPRFIYLFN